MVVSVDRRGLHLELHSDIGRIASLLPLVPQDVTVVLHHFGKPSVASLADEVVQAVTSRQRTGSETYVTFSGDLTALPLDLLGRDRLLWASGWLCTNHESKADYARLRVTLNDWLPEASDRQAALQGDPQRLY